MYANPVSSPGDRVFLFPISSAGYTPSVAKNPFGAPAMKTPTRRQFLTSTVAAGAAVSLGTAGSSAIEPIHRNGKSHIRLSIAAYSYRKHLDLRTKPKPSMTLDDFVETAAGMGLDAVEPTAYYFAETSPDYLAHLKGKCTRLGLDVSGTAVGNNFCVRHPEKLREQIA